MRIADVAQDEQCLVKSAFCQPGMSSLICRGLTRPGLFRISPAKSLHDQTKTALIPFHGIGRANIVGNGFIELSQRCIDIAKIQMGLILLLSYQPIETGKCFVILAENGMDPSAQPVNSDLHPAAVRMFTAEVRDDSQSFRIPAPVEQGFRLLK